ncbi:hypothetical protein BDR04DRAFT_1121805 [Suillus decipiens]|nr:hypothetical protein BDR04DRAFT_1121805 [Suillus decipiens]
MSPLPDHGTENDIVMDNAECQVHIFSPLIEPQASSSLTQMTDASTSPIIGPKSADFSHQTPSPARSFLLPSAIKDHLNWLVAQHFLKLSDHVLVSALKNTVNTLIPSVVEQISDNMRNATIGPYSHRCKDKNIQSDMQTSDSCIPELSTRERTSQGEKCLLPQPPPPGTLHAFNDNNDCSPTLDDISIDWNDSLKKSLWNTEVINLLVIDFQAKVSNGIFEKVIFNPGTMSLDNLCTYQQDVQIGKLANIEDMNWASHELSA